ncbi:MAG: hypothetical protein KAH17_01495 [Bacteroidales bacterium]|nr:hypothetical protein [Bacteroidales bacterium]
MQRASLLIMIVFPFLSGCNDRVDSFDTHLYYEENQTLFDDISEKVASQIGTVYFDSITQKLGYSASILEFIGDTIVGYAKYLNKLFLISPKGKLLNSFDLEYKNEIFSVFSFAHCRSNNLIYMLDAKLNIVLGVTISGNVIHEISVPFAPLHILCNNNRLFYYNPYPRNKYSDGYILSSTDLYGQDFVKLLKIKPLNFDEIQGNDISWIFSDLDTLKMYNRSKQRIVQYNVRDKTAKVIILKMFDLEELQVLNVHLCKSIPDKGFILAKKDNLFTPLSFSLSTGGVCFLPESKDYPRLFWGVEFDNHELPFFPFQVAKSGVLYRTYKLHGDTNSIRLNVSEKDHTKPGIISQLVRFIK